VKPVVIVGAGGHAREVAEIVQALHALGRGGPLVGLLTDVVAQHGTHVLGIPVLGPPAWIDGHPEVAVVIAVGDNRTRQQIAARLAPGWSAIAVISPHALISPHASVGPGAMVFPGVVIGPLARIGAHTIVNVGASVSHDSVVGEWANLNPGVRLAGNVSIGAGANIGMGAAIIQGRTVGAWATVGAGAVVVRDLPAAVTAVGVPARVR
jgi:sugar O-acyltransferase (sialic acid O-acetyltransferase NeuD family)